MIDFSDLLKQARTDKGYTQKKVAELLNLSESGYAHWEQGRTEPSIEMLRKICIALDVSSDYLLNLVD